MARRGGLVGARCPGRMATLAPRMARQASPPSGAGPGGEQPRAHVARVRQRQLRIWGRRPARGPPRTARGPGCRDLWTRWATGYQRKLTMAVFSSVGCKRKNFLRFESSQFEVLNEVYL